MTELLESSVEALKSLRAELHGKVEDSVIERIDEILRDLENVEIHRTRQYNPIELLILLGSVIEKLRFFGNRCKMAQDIAVTKSQ